jgi:hypothetical protein
MFSLDANALHSRIMSNIEIVQKVDIKPYPRMLLLLYAASNLFNLGVLLYAKGVTSLRITEKTFGPVALSDRIVQAKKILEPIQRSTALIEQVWDSLNDDQRKGSSSRTIPAVLSVCHV